MTTRISSKTLATVAAQTGPCLTLVVPDHHPGMPERSQKTHLRELIKVSKRRTAGIPNAAWPEGFETPLEELAESIPNHGGPGFVVYRTPDSLTSFPFTAETPQAVLASHPCVMPLLLPAFAAHDLVILGLSTKQLRLLEYVDGVCRQIALPAGVPESLEAAGHFHASTGIPGENQKPAGPSVGTMAGVRFGTSGERESARDSIEHFCALIDQGLRPALHNRPLLLMGVKEEIDAYRRVSHYHFLMHAEVDGNIQTYTPSQIAALADKAALSEYQRLGEQVLGEFREMRDRQRAIHGPREVLQAAAAGRVHQLCVSAGTEMFGPMEDELNRAHLPTEDLINAAVVETLRRNGEIYVLPQDSMPVTESVCAILRY